MVTVGSVQLSDRLVRGRRRGALVRDLPVRGLALLVPGTRRKRPCAASSSSMLPSSTISSAVEEQHPVRVPDTAPSQDARRSPGPRPLIGGQGIDHRRLVLGIQGTGRLVHQQHGRRLDQGTGDAEPAAAHRPTGAVPASTHLGAVPVGQPPVNSSTRGQPRRGGELPGIGIRIADQDVGPGSSRRTDRDAGTPHSLPPCGFRCPSGPCRRRRSTPDRRSVGCRPAMSDRMVLFPEPDGPTIAVVPPGSRTKLTSCSTGGGFRNRKLTPSNSIRGALCQGQRGPMPVTITGASSTARIRSSVARVDSIAGASSDSDVDELEVARERRRSSRSPPAHRGAAHRQEGGHPGQDQQGQLAGQDWTAAVPAPASAAVACAAPCCAAKALADHAAGRLDPSGPRAAPAWVRANSMMRSVNARLVSSADRVRLAAQPAEAQNAPSRITTPASAASAERDRDDQQGKRDGRGQQESRRSAGSAG